MNRNFAAEIVGGMQERQLFLRSIAIRNASDDIQVFNEIRDTVLSPLRFPGQECAISSFSKNIVCAKIILHSMAEWAPSTIVIVWLMVRILAVSQVWFVSLQIRVARASDLFASSEGYMCD